MNKNRTWVEEGDYSIPSHSKKPLIPTKAKGLIWLCAFMVLSELALNYFWSYRLGAGHLILSPLWGWMTYIKLLKKYGIENILLIKTALALSASFLISAVIFRVLFFDRNDADSNMTATLHGSSHWAKKDEIIRAGLISPKKTIKDTLRKNQTTESKASVILGGWADTKGKTHYLKHSGPEHVIAIAPTRSGKGVGLVVPTLLNWAGSVLVLDIKGENWLLSAGWRQKNIGPCLRFEPTDPGGDCARYNPLAEVNTGTTNETREIQQIAGLIIDPDGKGLDDYWAKAGYSLLTGAITHELYRALHEKREPSIAKVRADITSDDKNRMLENWRNYNHTVHGVHPVVKSVADEMLGKAEKELSGVFSTANSCLNLWLDNVIVKNTTNSTFHIQDLVNQDKPISIYIVIPPSDLVRLRPILRLFVTQVVFTLTQKMEAKNGEVTSGHKHKLLLMLDEFPQLRKLDLLEAALAFMGGYGVKAYMICQSFKQLTDIYGKDETVSSNCHLQICYAPNDEDTARIVSEKCGKTTATVGSSSISGKRFAIGPFGKTSESISYSQHSRDLMTPDETKRLPTAVKDADGRVVAPGDLLVFASGTAPIYGVQTPFFLDKKLDERSKMPPSDANNFKPLPFNRPDAIMSSGSLEERHAFVEQQRIEKKAQAADEDPNIPNETEIAPAPISDAPPLTGDSDEADDDSDDDAYNHSMTDDDHLGLEAPEKLDVNKTGSNADKSSDTTRSTLLETLYNSNIYEAPSASTDNDEKQ